MTRPSSDPSEYLPSVRWFRQRLAMTGEDFKRVVKGNHERAFTVAGVAQLDLVTQVWEALDTAMVKGETLEDFRKAVEEKLTAAWGAKDSYRVETIFRTNLQHAYSRGRWEQQNDPAVKAVRPYWEFSAVMDLRTSEICRPLNGTVRPADDGFWSWHNPPLHHSCRSTIISLTEEQAKARGITPEPPDSTPADGFGGAPGEDDWHPDLSKYPHELAAVAGVKLAAR